MTNFKTKDAVGLAAQCRSESETAISARLLDWIKYAEFERGNQNIYQSKQTRQVIRLTRGAYIPEKNRFFSDDYMPILNHLGVVSDSIDSRANANALKPLVRPKTSEDADRDAAKASTLALQSYDQTLDGRKIRKEAVKWLKVTGTVFGKTWWDRDLGDILPSLPEEIDPLGLGSQHLLNSSIVPQRTGDLQDKIVPPQAMIVSPGASSMEDLRYIGDQSAINVYEAKNKYGVDVQPEAGLQNLRQLQAVDTVMNISNGELQDCVRVIDLYFPPSPTHPKPEQKQFGRHIIVVGNQCVEDGVWDRALTERYGIWHPYTQCKFKCVAGDFWGETPYKDLCEDQTEINRQWRMAAGSKQIIRNIITYQDTGTIDTDKLRLTKHGQGLAELPYEGNTPPTILNVQGGDGDYITKIEYLKRNMDDRVASYRVTRGDTDPNVQSGKQQQALVQASTAQINPLLMNLATWFRDRWQLMLRLLSVHITQEKALRLVGEDNEIISVMLKPEYLTSDDVEIEDLQGFLMDPETKRQQIMQNFMAGIYGNPQDPTVRQEVARMLEIPFSEELDEIAKDMDQAKRENHSFSRGELDEKNPAILARIKQEYTTAIMQYKLLTAVGASEGQAAPLQQLPQINLWKRPRPWENHQVHIEVHNNWRKSGEFENLCAENPQIFDAVEFHVQEHERMVAEAMAKQMMQMPIAPQVLQAQRQKQQQKQESKANQASPL